MEQLDLKLKLFGGQPIHAENYGFIEPLKVREIIRYGYSNYMKSLNLLCLSVDDLIKTEDEEKMKELKDIPMIEILLAFGEGDIEKNLEEAISFFLKGKAVVDKKNLSVLLEKEDDVVSINGENFHHIVEVLRWQNYIKHFKEENKVDNDANEETRKFKERLKELQRVREEVKKKKNGDKDEESSPLDFYDIISSISSKSNSINELNVLDLTVYQVYSKFKRMETIDKFDIDIKSILAGSKDVKLKHWSSKID